MKIMTINMHSYIEAESEKKLQTFIDAISRIKPDIIAMQEVNQSTVKKPAAIDTNIVFNQYGIELKADNYGLRIALALSEKGLNYKLLWVGIKRGFNIFDEGLCFLSRVPITFSDAFLISKTDSITNWKKRMVLGIEAGGEWFYNVHMGRWDDKEEPFYNQWTSLNKKINANTPVWIMGDFNSPADYKNEGYDLVLSSGFYDTYTLAKSKDKGYTISGRIDGWSDKKESFEKNRIDYIFTNTKREIETSYTIFNGENEEIISDHFGILLTYERN